MIWIHFSLWLKIIGSAFLVEVEDTVEGMLRKQNLKETVSTE